MSVVVGIAEVFCEVLIIIVVTVSGSVHHSSFVLREATHNFCFLLDLVHLQNLIVATSRKIAILPREIKDLVVHGKARQRITILSGLYLVSVVVRIAEIFCEVLIIKVVTVSGSVHHFSFVLREATHTVCFLLDLAHLQNLIHLCGGYADFRTLLPYLLDVLCRLRPIIIQPLSLSG